MTTPEFMTLPEAAALLRSGEHTACNLARERRIPTANVGGQWRIRRVDLDGCRHPGGEAGTGGEAR